MIGTRALRLGALAFIGALLATGITVTPAAAAAAVPGLQHVSAVSAATSSAASRSAAVACPAGKRTVGVGGSILHPITPGHASIVAIQPFSNLRGGVVLANPVAPHSPTNWKVRVDVLCADPLPGLEVVHAVSQQDSQSAKGVSAFCPRGKKAIGGGGEVVGADPDMLWRLALDEIVPFPNLNGFNTVGVETILTTPETWVVGAWAICANPLPGLQVLRKVGPTAEAPERAGSVSCPPRQHILSGAGRVNAVVHGQSVLQSISFTNGPFVSVVGGRIPEPLPHLRLPWSVTSFVICSNA